MTDAETPNPAEDIAPESLSWTPEGHMAIRFNDGIRVIYSPEVLRSICPCAICKGTHGTPPKAFAILSGAQLKGADKQTTIMAVEPVGRYGVAFTWGDGHKDGLYTWSYLRAQRS